MDSLERDSRFSRVLTDPRFLPMPSFQKKVKIDNRFSALFTSKHFGHRTLKDKRGRPIHDVSKRGKHVMEQFYQLSSDDSSSDEESTEDEDSAEKSETAVDEETYVDPDSNCGSKLDKKCKDSVTVKDKKEIVGKKRRISEQQDSDDEKTDVIFLQPSDGKKARKETKSLKKQHSKDSLEKEREGQKKSSKKLKSSDLQNISPKKLKQKSSGDALNDLCSQGSDDEKEDTMDNNAGPDKDNNENIVGDDDAEEEKSNDESTDSDSSETGSEEEQLPVYKPEHDLEETTIEHKWNELHADASTVSESTHRLAVCNMDWDFVKAQDLFVLFKSFAGEGGSVRSVTIYPSEFGKERMAEEARIGPKEMRERYEKNLEEEDKGAGRRRNRRKKERYVDQQRSRRAERQIVKAEHEVLRQYQLNRLRYYYAVIDCSSVEVADNIYKECDGHEYQLSSVKLDLRYIPDNMTFEDVPKESFSEEQGLMDYTPRLFNSTALSQGKVEVTWDETDLDRLQKKMLHVLPKELETIVEENRHADIIAPPESDSDMEEDDQPQWLKSVLVEEDEDDVSEERKIQLYRKVLMDKLLQEEEKEKKENEVDKEMEWQPGLKSALESKLKKNEKTQGTLVDDYIEKKREKKKKKREQKRLEFEGGEEKVNGESKDLTDDGDFPDVIDDQLKELMESEGVSVDSVKGKKKKKKQDLKKKADEDKAEMDPEQEREAAELELLLMGDGEEKSVAKPEKMKKDGKLSRRQKKKKALLEKEKKKKEQEELTIDVDDPRFSAMFSSHHFHIDPSAPEFKKTNNMMKLVDEQIKRKPKMKHKKNNLEDNGGDGGKGLVEKQEEDSRTVSKKLIESLKKKMKK